MLPVLRSGGRLRFGMALVDVQFTPAGARLAVGLASGTMHLLETPTDTANPYRVPESVARL